MELFIEVALFSVISADLVLVHATNITSLKIFHFRLTRFSTVEHSLLLQLVPDFLP